MITWTRHDGKFRKGRTRFELHTATAETSAGAFSLNVFKTRKGTHGHSRARPWAVSVSRAGAAMPEWSGQGFSNVAQAKRVALAVAGVGAACTHCSGGWRFDRDSNGTLRDKPTPCGAC